MQNESQRGATRCPGGHLARPTPGARREVAWTPGATPGSLLWPIYPSSAKNPKGGGVFTSSAAAPSRKPTEKKRHIRRGDSAGRTSPGRGDHRHRHHHCHGHHRDHHQHHPQHQHHLHYHPISSHNCNLCCNPYYLSLYSIGVDYYFVVNAIEFCWRNIIVSRLFIIYLSPLIMISFMSCE